MVICEILIPFLKIKIQNYENLLGKKRWHIFLLSTFLLGEIK